MTACASHLLLLLLPLTAGTHALHDTYVLRAFDTLLLRLLLPDTC